jgi:hypothetical protein
LRDAYEMREYLATSSFLDAAAEPLPEVAQHIDGIERRLETRSYIETGPLRWSAIPYAADRLRGRVRVVHLTRHPVPTACSWLTHGAYQQPFLPHETEKTLLSPFDPGTRFGEYRERWETLGPFEKCLYYWAEVNAFALAFEASTTVPWFRLKYEDLFDGDGFERLLQFLDLPALAGGGESRKTVVDEFRFLTGTWQDLQTLKNHPRVIEIASQLGYDINAFDEAALRARYLMQDQK